MRLELTERLKVYQVKASVLLVRLVLTVFQVFKSRFFVLLEHLAQAEPIQLIHIIRALLLALNAQLVHSVPKKDFQPRLHAELATSHLLALANVLCVNLVNFALLLLKHKLFKNHKLALEFIVKSAFIIKHLQEDLVTESSV